MDVIHWNPGVGYFGPGILGFRRSSRNVSKEPMAAREYLEDERNRPQ